MNSLLEPEQYHSKAESALRSCGIGYAFDMPSYMIGKAIDERLFICRNYIIGQYDFDLIVCFTI